MIAPSGSTSRPTRTATRRGGGGPAVGTRLRTTPTCDGLSALRPSAMFAGISPPVLPSSSGRAFRVEHPSDREFGPQSRRRRACTGPDRRPEACTPQALHGEPGTLSMTGPVDPTSRPPRTSGTPGPNSGGSCPERCAVRAGNPRRPPDHRARRAGHPPRRRHRPRPGRRDPGGVQRADGAGRHPLHGTGREAAGGGEDGLCSCRHGGLRTLRPRAFRPWCRCARETTLGSGRRPTDGCRCAPRTS
jgi:hypothetical protein